MTFFESYFGITGDRTETAVCCPFPHIVAGTAYKEQHPSAHVNLESGLFHCKACGRGHSQTSFIQEILGCTYITALNLAGAFKRVGEIFDWDEQTALTGADMRRLN
jgi:DNA primase